MYTQILMTDLLAGHLKHLLMQEFIWHSVHTWVNNGKYISLLSLSLLPCFSFYSYSSFSLVLFFKVRCLFTRLQSITDPRKMEPTSAVGQPDTLKFFLITQLPLKYGT